MPLLTVWAAINCPGSTDLTQSRATCGASTVASMGRCEQCDELQRENASLRQALSDRQSDASNRLIAVKHDSGACTLSVVFDRKDIENKYGSAVQSFLQPICSQYEVQTEYLSAPQACKFLLWVTFVGNGRLPDNMQRFTNYADYAGWHEYTC